MPTSPMSEVLRSLRAAALRHDAGGRTDAELLADHLAGRDEAALAALVRRHGPMVWGVCRRVLADPHDAEDAFQAAFLVLVRRAASAAAGGPLASWLYGVACRTAHKVRATVARRKVRERQVLRMPEPAVVEPDPWPELRPLLDEELGRLPDRYRAVLVVCGLEGKTRREAAGLLGVPEGTVAGWLARARALLARRLAGRGLAVSCAGLAAGLCREASGGVPAAASAATIKAATLCAAGPAAAAGVVSARVAALTEGVLRSMLLTRLKPLGLVVLLLAAAAGLAARSSATGPAKEGRPPVRRAAIAPAAPAVPRAAQPPQERLVRLESDQVEALAFDPDSRLLAGGCMDRKVRLWDLRDNKLKATLEGPKGIVRRVAFSPDGKTLAAGADDGSVYLWDVATGKVTAELPDRPAFVNGLVFLPGGRLAATYNEDAADGTRRCRVKVWDLKKKTAETLYEQAGSAYSLALSPDGTLLAATLNGSDQTKAFHGLKVWDVGTGKEAWDHPAGDDFMTTVVFAPDGKSLAVGGGHAVQVGNGWATEGRLWVLDVKTRRPLWRVAEKENGTYSAVAFTADSKGVLTGSSGAIKPFEANGATGSKVVSELRRWDAATGKPVWRTEGELGHFADVRAAADGKTLAGGDSEQLMLFDPDTGGLREVLMKRTLGPEIKKPLP
jgi:RNA polymerase sigma factor (sigma-70 family)